MKVTYVCGIVAEGPGRIPLECPQHGWLCKEKAKMNYEIFAMQDKVAVKLTPPEERIGNILLPDTAKGDNHIGTIVSVGWCTNGVQLKVGDLVVVPRYAGSPVKIDGEELLFMKSSDVLATLLPIPRGVEAAHAGHD